VAKKSRKIIHEERYKSGALMIRKDLLPTVPSATGYEVIEAEVLTAGHYSDGNEFQTLRVVLREKE
jgi:hypothetical protein